MRILGELAFGIVFLALCYLIVRAVIQYRTPRRAARRELVVDTRALGSGITEVYVAKRDTLRPSLQEIKWSRVAHDEIDVRIALEDAREFKRDYEGK